MTHTTAGDVMNPEVFSVPLEMSVVELVDFFAAWGPTDEATLAGRRRLSSLLFA